MPTYCIHTASLEHGKSVASQINILGLRISVIDVHPFTLRCMSGMQSIFPRYYNTVCMYNVQQWETSCLVVCLLYISQITKKFPCSHVFVAHVNLLKCFHIPVLSSPLPSCSFPWRQSSNSTSSEPGNLSYFFMVV